jgi:S-formylglutathione hydrolase FrmB
MARTRHVLAAVCALLIVTVTTAGASETTGSTSLRGTIAYGSFPSPAIRATDHYAVYLPPDYGSSGKRYPVVYFLHGLPAGEDAYKNITPIAQAIEDSGQSAIVVGVQGSRASDTDAEWLDWGPGRNWETATAVDLVHVIDERYRTIAARAGRLLVGISAGGYGATLIADHHPGTYAVIESWSGYFHPTDPSGTVALDLGSRDANEWASFAKQIPRLRTRFGRWFDSTYYAFYVGTNDTRFRAENEAIERAFVANHIPHVYFRIYPGGHSWSLWGEHAEAWLGGGLRFAASLR